MGPLNAFCDYTGIDSKPLKRAIKDVLDQYVDSHLAQTEQRPRPPFWEGVPQPIKDQVRGILSGLLSGKKRAAEIESTSEYEAILAAYMNETLRSRYYNKGGGKETPSVPIREAPPAGSAPEGVLAQEDLGSVSATEGVLAKEDLGSESAPEGVPAQEDLGSVNREESTPFRPW